MRYLLDTHVLLWAVNGGGLSREAESILSTESNELFVSPVSAWEMATKLRSGRLEMPITPEALFSHLLAQVPYRQLPPNVDHALSAAALPLIHRDPFDRLLIAQSRLEGIRLLTADRLIAPYEVETIW